MSTFILQYLISLRHSCPHGCTASVVFIQSYFCLVCLVRFSCNLSPIHIVASCLLEVNEPKSVVTPNQMLSLRWRGLPAGLTLHCDWISTLESQTDLTNPSDPKSKEREGKFPFANYYSNQSSVLLFICVVVSFSQQLKITNLNNVFSFIYNV